MNTHVFSAATLVKRAVVIYIVLAAMLVLPSAAQLNVWQPTGPVHDNFWGYLTIAVDPTDNNIVYTGTYHTSAGYRGVLFKTTTAGPPWTILNAGLGDSPISKIVINREEPNVVFVVTYYSGSHIYKSNDGGLSWRLKDPPSFGYVGTFEIPRSDSKVIYAAGDRLYVSHDLGETWSIRGVPNSWDISEAAVSPHDPNLIFAAVCEYYDEKNCDTRLYKSSNGGITWSQPVLDPPGSTDITALEVDPLRPNVVYAATNDWISQANLYKSNDRGMTWTPLPTPPSIYGLEFDPRVPTTMYAVGMFNLAKSTDGGVTWVPFTNGIPQFGPGFLDLDFTVDGKFIHAATSTGVFRAQVRDDLPAYRRVVGRVTTGGGRTVARAVVSIENSLGVVRRVTTNSFGYYVFEDVQATYMYRMYVSTKGYQFPERIVQVDTDLSDVDFVGEPLERPEASGAPSY